MTDTFWDVANELMAEDGRLAEGTIMGQPCLRLGKEFVAMPELNTNRAVFKLNANRVLELIDSGDATSFAPAGKIFSEWAAVADSKLWHPLLEEAIKKAAH